MDTTNLPAGTPLPASEPFSGVKDLNPRLLPDILSIGASLSNQKGRLLAGDRVMDCHTLDHLSTSFALALRDAGLQPGDRVIMVLSNPHLFTIACFAIWKAGGIAIPESPTIRPPSLQYIFQITRPAVIITEDVLLPRFGLEDPSATNLRAIFLSDLPTGTAIPVQAPVYTLNPLFEARSSAPEKLPASADPDEVVSITFTSGSTGTPKGVLHTHTSWLSGVIFTRDHLQLSPTDTIVIPLPLHHAYAFRHVLAHLLAGASIIITTNIYQAIQEMRQHQSTGLLLVPTVCHILLDHFGEILAQADSHLRYVEIGTAPLAPPRYHQLRERLPATTIHLPYGLTEARVGYLSPGETGQLNQITHPVPGLEIRVVDDAGHPVQPGETGEIVLRGAGLMKGYWSAPPQANEQLQTQGFRTGDLGRLNAAGQVELLGRIDNVLKVGGRKVVPTEIEHVLNRHPAIAESAVIGLPDPTGLLEQQIHAFVVVREGQQVNAKALDAHCRRFLEAYKIPSQFHFRSSLPKSSVGKIQYPSLTID